VLQPFNELFTDAQFPQMLAGLGQPDDAAVYQLDENRALISTTDFFPPVVDDPYDFGAIAAANALSDVYAMGGKPLLAINLAAFPDGYEMDLLAEILRGGAEKALEAGVAIGGGHTVADKEPKYGLCVTGEVHPQRIIKKSGAQPGDVLILTKPLGSGVLTTALKQQRLSDEHLEAVVTGMKHLNKTAAEVVQRNNDIESRVHAMTDITGYGLAGHGHELAHLSGVDLHLNYDALQWYPGTTKHALDDVFAGGMHRNREYFSQWLTLPDSLTVWQGYLLYDPQTSGGLLMAVAPDVASVVLDDLLEAGEQAAIIGKVAEGEGGLIVE
jgi:selenide,water dikinase